VAATGWTNLVNAWKGFDQRLKRNSSLLDEILRAGVRVMLGEACMTTSTVSTTSGSGSGALCVIGCELCVSAGVWAVPR
jgi:hypothetical protein